MGQQQLLLIVLGLVVVSVAVVLGLNMFNANMETSAQDAIAQTNQHLGTQAIAFYNKPTDLGGGGKSFVGFTVPTNLVTTASGGYVATPNGAVDCVIIGTPLVGNDYTWTIKTTVTPTSVTTVIVPGA